ncbi:MAG: ShlB/FhaC/HecB family hemolysin secretion/activation protein [Rickettsiales bacterium]|nr:ShlB/FhaC/HecB family hemolysin secretion/activation protein [Rickettsiales bacterium]
MKKFLTSLSIALVLFGNIFTVKSAIAIENAADARNSVAAHHNQKRTFIDKQIISELHRRKQSEQKPVPEHSSRKESKVSWQQHNKISKIIISGNKAIKTGKIRSVIKPYLKKKIGENEARQIVEDIEKYYHKEGYALPVAYVEVVEPELRVKIIEGKLRTVVIGLVDDKRDKKILKNKLFLKLVEKIEKANPLKTKDLQRYLLLINKIHGYNTEYEIEQLGEIESNKVADLLMHVSTERGQASVSVNNHGTSDLGKHQFEAFSQFYNVLSNDSVMVSAGTSDKPSRFQLITLGYLKRLNTYGTSASIFFSHLKDDPNLAESSKDNKTNIVKGRLDQYAVLNNNRSVKLELAAERRDTEHYSGTSKTRGYDYVMGSLGGKIKIVDPLNVENWFFPYFNWTLNRVSYDKDSTDRIDFDKSFNYFIIDWYRDQPLPNNFSLFLKASYQYTGKLLPSEHRYSINTSNTARGYKTGLVSADQGISGKVELRYSKEFEKPKIKKFLNLGQFFGFFDITHFINHNTTSARKEHRDIIYFNKSTLPALGVGVRLFFPYGFYAESTVEFPTVRSIKVNGDKNNNSSIFRFLISKEFSW